MLRPIAPFVEYAVNYDYISKVLCINKDKPEMNCKGKCHLMKELEKQQEDDFQSLRISMKEYPIGFVKIYSILKEEITLLFKLKSPFFYQKQYSYLMDFSIFHPPIF